MVVFHLFFSRFYGHSPFAVGANQKHKSEFYETQPVIMLSNRLSVRLAIYIKLKIRKSDPFSQNDNHATANEIRKLGNMNVFSRMFIQLECFKDISQAQFQFCPKTWNFRFTLSAFAYFATFRLSQALISTLFEKNPENLKWKRHR